jgi:uncharacterized protein YjbI with pentapeptide repeats
MTIENIEDVVADGVDLTNGDFRKQDLSGLVLSGAKFHACDFRETDLSDSNLAGADLTDALLVDANLSCAALDHANFARANLTGAKLLDASTETADFTDCIGIVDAGTDPRGYRFIGVKQSDGTWMVKAGCRWFTMSRAIEHWTDRGNYDAMARVRLINETV